MSPYIIYIYSDECSRPTYSKSCSLSSSVMFPETATKTGMIMLLGEITTRGNIDYQKIVRDTVKKIGFDDSAKGWLFSCFHVEMDSRVGMDSRI